MHTMRLEQLRIDTARPDLDVPEAAARSQAQLTTRAQRSGSGSIQ
jgi:hypothetical protein